MSKCQAELVHGSQGSPTKAPLAIQKSEYRESFPLKQVKSVEVQELVYPKCVGNSQSL